MTTRLMGDTTHLNVSSLPPGLQLVAGYDTGTSDIRWVASDWARFPSAMHVHIDQGGAGAPVYSATVQDVETGAWSPQSVPGWQAACTAARPTVYCNRSDLPTVLATGWRGEIWLAYPGWSPGTALPAVPAGCSFVAVQNAYLTTYDTSVVLDPTWPAAKEDLVITLPGVPGQWIGYPTAFIDSTTGQPYYVGQGTNGHVYMTKFANGAWTNPVVL